MKTPARLALETELKKLSSATYQELRAAYYKAAEGAAELAAALERADAEAGGNTVLLTQHFAATAADELLGKTNLGAAL